MREEGTEIPPELAEMLLQERKEARSIHEALTRLASNEDHQMWVDLLRKNLAAQEKDAVYGAPSNREFSSGKCQGVKIAIDLIDFTLSWAESVLAEPKDEEETDGD